MPFTTANLLTEVKSVTRLPEGQVDYSDQRILDIATQELYSNLQPWLVSIKENLYVKVILNTVNAGQASYPISARSTLSGLREIKLIDSVTVTSLDQIDEDDVLTNTTGKPQYFYLQGNSIILYPTPATSYVLKQTIYFRPGELTTSTKKATITGIAGNVATVSYDSSLTSGAVNGQLVDIISQNSPHDTVLFDQLVTASGANITFPASLSSDISIGDYVVLRMQSPVPQLPVEAAQILSLLTSARIFESLNYQAELANTVGKIEKIKSSLKPVLSPRILGASIRVTPTL